MLLINPTAVSGTERETLVRAAQLGTLNYALGVIDQIFEGKVEYKRNNVRVVIQDDINNAIPRVVRKRNGADIIIPSGVSIVAGYIAEYMTMSLHPAEIGNPAKCSRFFDELGRHMGSGKIIIEDNSLRAHEFCDYGMSLYTPESHFEFVYSHVLLSIITFMMFHELAHVKLAHSHDVKRSATQERKEENDSDALASKLMGHEVSRIGAMYFMAALAARSPFHQDAKRRYDPWECRIAFLYGEQRYRWRGETNKWWNEPLLTSSINRVFGQVDFSECKIMSGKYQFKVFQFDDGHIPPYLEKVGMDRFVDVLR